MREDQSLAKPVLLPGQRLVEHRASKGGKHEHGVRLYLTDRQRDRSVWYAHPGPDLLTHMSSLPAANVNVARLLMQAPSSIQEWTFGRRTYTFWGTVVKNTDDMLLVPQMHFDLRWWLMYVPLLRDGRTKRAASWYGNDYGVLLNQPTGSI